MQMKQWPYSSMLHNFHQPSMLVTPTECNALNNCHAGDVKRVLPSLPCTPTCLAFVEGKPDRLLAATLSGRLYILDTYSTTAALVAVSLPQLLDVQQIVMLAQSHVALLACSATAPSITVSGLPAWAHVGPAATATATGQGQQQPAISSTSDADGNEAKSKAQLSNANKPGPGAGHNFNGPPRFLWLDVNEGCVVAELQPPEGCQFDLDEHHRLSLAVNAGSLAVGEVARHCKGRCMVLLTVLMLLVPANILRLL